MFKTKITKLFQELRRRRVINTVLLYVAGCWVGLQVATLVFLDFTENKEAMRYIFAALFAGLPIVITISWFYQLTTKGFVRMAAFIEQRGLDNIAPKNDRRVDVNTGKSSKQNYGIWSILAENGPLEGLEYPITDSITIGRALECEVTLSRSYISRSHARLKVDDDALSIEDLSSSNGTHVNGVKISGQQYLQHGDEVGFKDVTFRVHEDRTQLSEEVSLNQTIMIVNPPE
jgi:hypothetical protein